MGLDGEQVSGAAGQQKSRYIPESCTRCFDDVYWCFSPVHQSRHYYRYDGLDSCDEAWDAFTMCLKSRMKSVDDADDMYRQKEAQTLKTKTTRVWELTDHYKSKIESDEIKENSPPPRYWSG